VVFVGAAVVDVGVAGMGVEVTYVGTLVVVNSVGDGTTTVYLGSVGKLVGVGVTLGVGVIVSLGVSVTCGLGVSVAVLVPVTVRTNPVSQAATPANPMLYATNILINLVPESLSLSVNSLPIGCCTSHPYASKMVASMEFWSAPARKFKYAPVN
jgi:hypothetical protein